MEYDSQKRLLNELVNRIIVDQEGTIERMELQAPFAYLKDLKHQVNGGGEDYTGKTKTSSKAGQCSD